MASEAAAPTQRRGDLRNASPWLDAVETRKTQFLEEALRLGAMLTITLLVSYWFLSRNAGVYGEVISRTWSGTLLALSIAGALAIAIRRPNGRRSRKQLIIESAVMVLVAAAALSLSELHPDFTYTTAYADLAILMTGYAMLVPVAPKYGIPVLVGVASTFPLAQLLTGNGHLADFEFALHFTQTILGLTISAVILVLHSIVFNGRYSALGQLARLADQDPLTGAYNRRSFGERLMAEIDRCERYGVSFSLVMFDIDRFKKFNSEHGYAAGDAMLVAFVKSLQHVADDDAFRRFSPFVARYGGEEFMVLLSGCEPKHARRFAEQCRKTIDTLRVPFDGVELQTTASIGELSVARDTLADPSRLISAVDAAMYRSKAAGGDLVSQATARDYPRRAAPVDWLTGTLRRPDRHSPESPEALRDLRKIHALGVRLLAGLASIWLVLFAVIDVAMKLGPYPDLDLTSILLSRFLALCALGVLVLVVRATPDRPGLVTGLHALFLFATGFGSYWAMSQTGGLTSPYLVGPLYVVFTWAMAFSASLWVSVGVAATYAMLMPVYFVFVDGVAVFNEQLATRTGLIMAAALVSVIAQQQFRRLRRDEYATRHSLRDLARVDPLTGLGNRTAFEDRVRNELTRVDRDAPLSIVLLDLDHFKRLNDSIGHLAGDEALVSVAGVIEDELRAVDTAARIGGEEFVIALPHTDVENAEQVAERLRRRLHQIPIAGGSWKLSASFGVSGWSPDRDLDAIMGSADSALRQAKRSGRDRVVTATA